MGLFEPTINRVFKLSQAEEELQNLYIQFIKFSQDIDSSYTMAKAEKIINKWLCENQINVYSKNDETRIEHWYRNKFHTYCQPCYIRIDEIRTVTDASTGQLYTVDEKGNTWNIGTYADYSVEKAVNKVKKGDKVHIKAEIYLHGRIIRRSSTKLIFNITISKIKVKVLH